MAAKVPSKKVLQKAPGPPIAAVTPQNRVFDSLKSAAAALGVTLDALKRAKRAGCPAFRGSRVHEKDLVSWMANHSAEIPAAGSDREALENEILREQCRKLRNNNDEFEGLVVQRNLVAGALDKTLAAVRNLLERKLENEYPSLVVSMNLTEIRIKGRELSDSILTAIGALGALWEV